MKAKERRDEGGWKKIKRQATKVIRLPNRGLNNDGKVFFPISRAKIFLSDLSSGGGGGGGDGTAAAVEEVRGH